MHALTLPGPEAARLAELEEVIQRGLPAWNAIGRALCEIRDSRLYRATHATFESYCREKWKVGKSHGYRLIAAAILAEEVSTTAENSPQLGTRKPPENEHQARRIRELTAKALASLPPAEQLEVVQANEAAVMDCARAEAVQVGGAQTAATLHGAAGAARQLARLLRKLGGEYETLIDAAESLLAAVEAAAAEVE